MHTYIHIHTCTHIYTYTLTHTATERAELFAQGGCFIITSRLLITDLLERKVNVQNVLGILVANAHR